MGVIVAVILVADLGVAEGRTVKAGVGVSVLVGGRMVWSSTISLAPEDPPNRERISRLAKAVIPSRPQIPRTTPHRIKAIVLSLVVLIAGIIPLTRCGNTGLVQRKPASNLIK